MSYFEVNVSGENPARFNMEDEMLEMIAFIADMLVTLADDGNESLTIHKVVW